MLQRILSILLKEPNCFKVLLVLKNQPKLEPKVLLNITFNFLSYKNNCYYLALTSPFLALAFNQIWNIWGLWARQKWKVHTNEVQKPLLSQGYVVSLVMLDLLRLTKLDMVYEYDNFIEYKFLIFILYHLYQSRLLGFMFIKYVKLITTTKCGI